VFLAISSVAAQEQATCSIVTNDDSKSPCQDAVLGKLIHKVAPNYPPDARAARIQGTVVLWVVIGKDGKIKSLTPQSGPTELIPAAVEAVKHWRYSPFKVKGEIVEVQTDIHVNFTLSR
jgi:periplasmic protein TonB